MISLTGHIEYLILRHDCVVIPGIGALIAHLAPAYIDSEAKCIFPPKRSLSFNPEITHNDGLLATSVARKESVTYERALEMVEEDVKEMQAIIHAQGEFALGRIGTIRLNADNNSTYIFDSFPSTNVAPRLTGLNSLSIKKLSEMSGAVDHKDNSGKRDFYYIPRSIARIAASIVVFLMLGFALSTPIIDQNADMASMGIAISEAPSDAYSPSFELNPRIDFNIAFPDAEEATAFYSRKEKPCQEVTSPSKSTNRMNQDDEYFLIVASLPSKDKAEEYIREHSGIDSLGVLEADGRFRVYAASGATYSEANSYNKSGRYPDAWVCKR
ncbi:MAG: hypothetical protein NC127_07025 [Muribaculum sp.]|nr:hypothetical protein [Muribaculum sp.]